MKFFNRGPALRGKMTRWDIAALALFSLLFAAILLPIYSQNWMASRIFVYDANGNPVPFARLTFANANGTTNYFTITNERGESRDPIAIRLAERVSGPYKFHRMDWNSKAPAMRIISTRGAQTLTVKDEAGRPMPDVPIYLTLAPRGLYLFPHRASRPGDAVIDRIYRTDSHGVLAFRDMALCQRLEPYTENGEFVVQSIRVTTGADWVNYDVRLTRPATVDGTVHSVSGKQVTGTQFFAVIGPKHRYSGDFQHYPTDKTDPTGRILLKGLPAGDYAIYPGDPWKNRPPITPPLMNITVRSGETEQVTLRVP